MYTVVVNNILGIPVNAFLKSLEEAQTHKASAAGLGMSAKIFDPSGDQVE